jgi:hypothetical protein
VHRDDLLGVGVETRFESIDLHDEDRPGVEREPELERLLHRPKDELVEHLESTRNDAGADDVADRVGGIVDRLEDAEHRPVRFGIPRDPHPHLRDDAERPFRADDHAGQIVARHPLDRPPNLDDTPVRHHDLDAKDVVDSDAVLERVRAAGVGGDVAADRAGPLARRIGSEVEAVRLQMIRQPEVDDARLNDGVAVTDVHFQDPLHPREGDHDAAADRQTASCQTGSRSSRQERDIDLVAHLDDLGHLLGRGGKDDDVGPVLLDRVAVAFVNDELARSGKDALGSDDGSQTLDERGHRFLDKSL